MSKFIILLNSFSSYNVLKFLSFFLFKLFPPIFKGSPLYFFIDKYFFFFLLYFILNLFNISLHSIIFELFGKIPKNIFHAVGLSSLGKSPFFENDMIVWVMSLLDIIL